MRAGSLEELERVRPRVEACFRAGALASGCALEIEPESPPYSEFRNDAELVALYRRNAEGIGRRFAAPGDPAARMNRASTDMGNVSRVVRALHPTSASTRCRPSTTSASSPPPARPRPPTPPCWTARWRSR
ncbi:hypothetical protein ACFQZC_02545 [Streptacidiphilus monticola]